MIEVHNTGINPDLYCYETSIKFAEDFGKRLLERIKSDEDFLILEKRYLSPLEKMKEIAEQLTFEEGKRFGRRVKQYQKLNIKPIEFKQYSMPKELTEEFISLIPQWIKDIDTFHPVVQISRNGEMLPPHRGHQRKSSLFMLLQGNGEQTKWYQETDSFEVFDFFRVPDLDKIENIVTATLEPFKWTMFNHKAWHSVHKFGNDLRINIGIDFDNIAAEELLNIVKKNEMRV